MENKGGKSNKIVIPHGQKLSFFICKNRESRHKKEGCSCADNCRISNVALL